jgi:hypothetical protein
MKTTTAAAALLGGLSFAATAMSSGRLQAGDERRFGALRAPKARGEKAQRAALRSKRPHNRDACECYTDACNSFAALLVKGGPNLMDSTPLLSIGLFVYNGERFLEETLDSILSQTFTDFELIISDNASTDRTAEISQAYARADSRISYYRNEKNMGAGWNLRRVYELATGKYFKWAAADDLLEPEFLRRCVEALESDPGCVVAYARTKEIDANGTFIKQTVWKHRCRRRRPLYQSVLMC